ncbi:hypothetical protein ACIGEP_06115 [Microbacterium sp. NPDC077663]|uniref:hypothetical protein n=1 Tax=Microbacterium sp. NPDC077663 TaxID=3364189 RepID=UPI0037C7C321
MSIDQALSDPRCRICTHPDRASIELDIAEGVRSARALGREHGVGRDSIRRHWERHVALRAQAAVFLGAAPARAGDLLTRLVDVADHLAEIRADADEAGDSKTALGADRALVTAIERLRVGMGLGEADVARDYNDLDALAAAVEAQTRSFPDLGVVVAEGLEEAGHLALARTVRDFAERQAAALTTTSDRPA